VFLVVISIISMWIITPIFGSAAVNQLGPFMVVKTARLARLARALRLLKQFKQLWLLVSGLMSSARTVLDTMILLTVLLYIFGTVGVELIRLDPAYMQRTTPDAYAKIVHEYFPNLPLTMLTLLQFVCMDSIGSIYRPMILQNGYLAFYFIVTILIIAVVFMNIVTAVVVNSALEQAAEEKAQQADDKMRLKRQMMSELLCMFERLDKDKSGKIERREIENASEMDRAVISQFMDNADPLQVFDLLDIDGGGELDTQEFCEGLYLVSVSSTPIELRRIDKRVTILKQEQQLVNTSISEIKEILSALQSELQIAPKHTIGTSKSSQTESSADSKQHWIQDGTLTAEDAMNSESPMPPIHSAFRAKIMASVDPVVDHMKQSVKARNTTVEQLQQWVDSLESDTETVQKKIPSRVSASSAYSLPSELSSLGDHPIPICSKQLYTVGVTNRGAIPRGAEQNDNALIADQTSLHVSNAFSRSEIGMHVPIKALPPPPIYENVNVSSQLFVNKAPPMSPHTLELCAEADMMSPDDTEKAPMSNV